MDPLTSTAASGMRARMESLDMLANNIANSATDGYKSDREFYDLYVSSSAGGDPVPSTMPVIERPWTDLSQGVLRTTGNSLDLALEGRGFFAVDGPSGPLYTRNGSFHAAADGSLVSSDGYPVRTVGGTKLRLNATDPVTVNPDGAILQGGQPAGKLEVVDFPDTVALTKQGNTLFRVADPNAKPTSATKATVHQGKLEQSNVGTAESAVRLVSVMRQFEMLQKAISIGTEMNRRAVEEVARPNS
jgi:flagellar basal-body rod protein FlgG